MHGVFPSPPGLRLFLRKILTLGILTELARIDRFEIHVRRGEIRIVTKFARGWCRHRIRGWAPVLRHGESESVAPVERTVGILRPPGAGGRVRTTGSRLATANFLTVYRLRLAVGGRLTIVVELVSRFFRYAALA
jgi:hypothetical protein